MKKGVAILTFCLLGIAAAWSESETMVYLEQAETLIFDEERHPDAQILKGNVRFRHDDALMYCDSAYFYESSNSLDAFGHVRFVQGDTLFGYCDKLFYDGNTRFAKMRYHVKLEDKSTTLTTDSLNYDRANDLAWYYTGGQIVDSVNTLTSIWGQYTSHDNQALFRGEVHLKNDKFVMDADTLKYNTSTNISDIVGPTTIIYEEETTIYTTLGWYNTQTEQSELLQHSLIVHTDGNTMTGDTIYYDKQLGFGRAIGHIEFVDSADHITLYGHYGEMWEETEKGNNIGFATDSALMVDWSDSTAFSYMHGDTLFTEEIAYKAVGEIIQHDSVRSIVARDSILIDSILTWQPPDTVMVLPAPDTLWRDTAYRQIRARHGVRIYREDMQAVCDSSRYNSRDSILSLYGTPVMWSDDQQVSADMIDIYMKDNEADHLTGTGNAMIIQMKHPIYYNQISGQEMIAYIENQELRQLDMDGGVEAGVFPQEEDSSFVAFNKVASAKARFYFKDGALDRAVFLSKPVGTAFPLKDLPEEQTHLSGFFWAGAERPLFPDDVFRKAARTPRNGQITEASPEQKAEARTKDKKGRDKDRKKKKSKSKTNTE